MSGQIPFTPKLSMKPIIICNDKKVLLKKLKMKPVIVSALNFRKSAPAFQDDVIYKSSNCDFLKGEPQDVLIVNRINLATKTCRTIARLTSKTNSVETTSDDVCALLGQKNYDTVLSALGSVFNEETKVRGILALLKPQTTYSNLSIQTEKNKEMSLLKKLTDQAIQTEESQVDVLKMLKGKQRQRKRIRRQQITPYVVKDHSPLKKVKKCIISVSEAVKTEDVKDVKCEEKDLPDLKLIIDEDSNMSCGSNISLSSIPSIPDVLEKTSTILSKIVENVTDKQVNSAVVTVRDGSHIMVPVKPEDQFHIATPEILKNVTHEERMKLVCHQAYIDFQLCTEQDEDGFLPLHVAVMHGDADLARRQCLALRARREPVDTPAQGLSALHIAVRQSSVACVRQLLLHGADPLRPDAEGRSALHLAAAAPAPLAVLLTHCDTSARQVLQAGGLWRGGMEAWSDARLAALLYERVCAMCDDQGYTPLMLAARAACPATVSLFAPRTPRIDARAPCGSTALLHAVSRACELARESGNRTTVPEDFLRTIEILVEHGADPAAENLSGASVNSLLTEFNISALSMTVANKMTAINHRRFTANDLILYKEKDGRIGFKNSNNFIEYKGPKAAHEDKKQFQEVKVEIKEEKKSPGLNVTTDKTTGLKVVKGNRTVVLNEINSTAKVKEEKTDKVIIVENVPLKKEVLSHIGVPSGSTVVSKPKNYVLKTRKDIIIKTPVKADGHRLPRPVKIAPKMPRSVKIAPKIIPKISIRNAAKIVIKSKRVDLDAKVIGSGT